MFKISFSNIFIMDTDFASLCENVNNFSKDGIFASDKYPNRLTKEDWRALTPLFYLHINPYGEFSLDLTTRLGIEDTVTV